MPNRPVSALKAISVVATLLLCACSIPQNKLSLYQRSIQINNEADVEQILSKASIEERVVSGEEKVNLLQVQGTPYEMGFQHGALLKEDIQAMYSHVIRRIKLYASEDMMDEVYDLMAPYIPLEDKEEMRGLAHGADVPLKTVHWMHSIAEVSEYGPKKRFRRGFKQTSCSNLVAFGNATVDGEIYQLRVLDWIRDLGVQNWPVVLVHKPQQGNASVSFSYAGFIGTVSGMNDQKMGFGEMGYGDPPGETLEGIPFIFLFRKLMREADTLEDAQNIISGAQRTSSYVYVVSDAKKKPGETNALLFITDRNRFLTFEENTHLIDEREEEDGDTYPAIDDVVYGGAKGEELHDVIQEYYGRISIDTLKEMTKPISLKSNMQNVIFKPATLEAWVSNANGEKGEKGKAANRDWLYLDLADILKN